MVSDEEMRKLADDAVRERRRWRADKLAQRIGLTYADRQRLGITMIGAIDVPKAERDRLREARKIEARRLKRRAAGAVTRDQYEASARARGQRQWRSASSPTPCGSGGSGRCPKSDRPHHKDISAGVTLGTPSQSARLRGSPDGGSLILSARSASASWRGQAP